MFARDLHNHTDEGIFLSSAEEAITAPPPNLPIPVQCSFNLTNLVGVNEREETFTVDISYLFKWLDPRLSFKPSQGTDVKIYLEDAADEQLRQIWWPHIEFSRPIYLSQWRDRILHLHNG